MATKKEKIDFVKAVYPEAQKLQHKSLANALFLTAQAACETGYSLEGSGENNLMGITKGSWTGRTKLCLTTEYFRTDNKTFAPPEKVVSITHRPDRGDFRYRVYRLFRSYDSIADCLEDHNRILQKEPYVNYWDIRMDPCEYAKAIAPAYATAPNYGDVLISFIHEVERILKENDIPV